MTESTQSADESKSAPAVDTSGLVRRLRDGVFGLNRIALCAEAADALEAAADRVRELEATLRDLVHSWEERELANQSRTYGGTLAGISEEIERDHRKKIRAENLFTAALNKARAAIDRAQGEQA